MYPDAEQPGLVIYRFDGPLIFANAKTFRDEIRAHRQRRPAAALDHRGGRADDRLDTTAADMLEELDGELEAAGIDLVFAEMKDAVRQKIERLRLRLAGRPRGLLPDRGHRGEGLPEATGIPKPDHHGGPPPA